MPKRLFPVPTTTNQSVEAGPAVTLKPSRWKRIFRRRRRSSSASSALSDTFSELSGEMSKTPSMEDIRVMGHVQEIVLRDVSPESAISSDVSTVISRKESVETLAPGLARDLFSDGALYVDALEGKEGEMQRYDTMKSVYVDATDGETMEEVEVKETVEITVVAEVQEGTRFLMGLMQNYPRSRRTMERVSSLPCHPRSFRRRRMLHENSSC